MGMVGGNEVVTLCDRENAREGAGLIGDHQVFDGLFVGQPADRCVRRFGEASREQAPTSVASAGIVVVTREGRGGRFMRAMTRGAHAGCQRRRRAPRASPAARTRLRERHTTRA